MGKPFEKELAALEATYRWASSHDVAGLARALARASGPLLAIGSGGSLTAAEYAAYLHERFRGVLARSATPLDARSVAHALSDVHALIVSAGGRNSDVLDAAAELIHSDPRSLTVLVAARGSPLAAATSDSANAEAVEFVLPSGKDGFLATNSLLAFLVLLMRAYAGPSKVHLPSSLAEILRTSSLTEFGDELDATTAALWDRDTVVVLYGPDTRAAALDVESKFTEAALGSIQLADYRNFAHGRHHWLAKRGRSSGVLALACPRDLQLARRTLAKLPKSVHTCLVTIPAGGELANIAGIITGFYLARSAGRKKGIDPGRPGVPEFGSQLYRMRAGRLRPEESREDAAVRRKLAASRRRVIDEERWRGAYRAFVENLRAVEIAGVVLDYDGTLCGAAQRYTGVTLEVAAEMRRLVEIGARIAVATGRGRSVTEDLRRVLPPQSWGDVLVGYYNGGIIAPLAEDVPRASGVVDDKLANVLRALQSDETLRSIARIEARMPQITVEPMDVSDCEMAWELTQAIVAGELQVVRSSHSIDVLAPGVSKKALVDRVEERAGSSFLRIGDRGRFPGNDHALLASPLGLSVDEVTPSPTTCWNITTPSANGVYGALEYLRAIHRRGGALRFELE